MVGKNIYFFMSPFTFQGTRSCVEKGQNKWMTQLLCGTTLKLQINRPATYPVVGIAPKNGLVVAAFLDMNK